MPRSKLERALMAIGFACVPLLACTTDASEVAARSSSAITNGAADSGDPAVVAIVGSSGTTECSGTLVGPYIVVTAGHCSVPEVVQGGHIAQGSSLADAGATIPIALAVAHPQFDLSTLTNDIAILVLASAAPATPVPLGTSPPAVGATVDLVGWGLTAEDAGDSGQKRQGQSTVTSLASTTFDVASMPSQPCEGDSGGPALATSNGVEAVVGITSHGDSACVAGATYTRVDAYLASFIQPT
ncbi:MAG: trypsin-like serine protease, partial [Polyangiaceae bacterium]